MIKNKGKIEDAAVIGDELRSSDAIPGSMEAWLRDPINVEAMTRRIQEMQEQAAVHGLGLEHEGYKMNLRAMTAKDLELRRK